MSTIALNSVSLPVRKGLLMLLGSVAIAISAQVTIPMWPVPATLQTLTVLWLGLACPRDIAVGAVFAYIVEAALGLPVLAGGTAGIAYLMGPTAGYIFGFIPLAYIASLASRSHRWHTFSMLTLASIVQLFCGFAVLSLFVGADEAWSLGVLPFVYGGALKILLVYGYSVAAFKSN